MENRQKHSEMALVGKVAVITGRGSGIGRSVALALAHQGSKVVICGRRSAKLEETIQEQIYRAPEMLKDPHFAEREAIVSVPHPLFGKIRMQNVVPKLSETPGGIRRPSPALGEHNDEIYLDLLGMPREGYERLQAARVI